MQLLGAIKLSLECVGIQSAVITVSTLLFLFSLYTLLVRRRQKPLSLL